MKRFAVNMLTIIVVLVIGCLFLFANPSGHGDGGTLGQMSNNSAKHGYYTPMNTNIDLSGITLDLPEE